MAYVVEPNRLQRATTEAVTNGCVRESLNHALILAFQFHERNGLPEARLDIGQNELRKTLEMDGLSDRLRVRYEERIKQMDMEVAERHQRLVDSYISGLVRLITMETGVSMQTAREIVIHDIINM